MDQVIKRPELLVSLETIADNYKIIYNKETWIMKNGKRSYEWHCYLVDHIPPYRVVDVRKFKVGSIENRTSNDYVYLWGSGKTMALALKHLQKSCEEKVLEETWRASGALLAALEG